MITLPPFEEWVRQQRAEYAALLDVLQQHPEWPLWASAEMIQHYEAVLYNPALAYYFEQQWLNIRQRKAKK